MVPTPQHNSQASNQQTQDVFGRTDALAPMPNRLDIANLRAQAAAIPAPPPLRTYNRRQNANAGNQNR